MTAQFLTPKPPEPGWVRRYIRFTLDAVVERPAVFLAILAAHLAVTALLMQTNALLVSDDGAMGRVLFLAMILFPTCPVAVLLFRAYAAAFMGHASSVPFGLRHLRIAANEAFTLAVPVLVCWTLFALLVGFAAWTVLTYGGADMSEIRQRPARDLLTVLLSNAGFIVYASLVAFSVSNVMAILVAMEFDIDARVCIVLGAEVDGRRFRSFRRPVALTTLVLLIGPMPLEFLVEGAMSAVAIALVFAFPIGCGVMVFAFREMFDHEPPVQAHVEVRMPGAVPSAAAGTA